MKYWSASGPEGKLKDIGLFIRDGGVEPGLKASQHRRTWNEMFDDIFALKIQISSLPVPTGRLASLYELEIRFWPPAA